jgi:hypothetical protein
MTPLLAMTAAALAAAPAPTMPAQGTVDFDVQCMVVVQQASDRVDESAKATLNAVAMFYFGRVDAAVSGEALKTRLRAAGKRIDGQQLGPMARACGEFMGVRSKALQQTGESLDAEQKAGSAK